MLSKGLALGHTCGRTLQRWGQASAEGPPKWLCPLGQADGLTLPSVPEPDAGQQVKAGPARAPVWVSWQERVLPLCALMSTCSTLGKQPPYISMNFREGPFQRCLTQVQRSHSDTHALVSCTEENWQASTMTGTPGL